MNDNEAYNLKSRIANKLTEFYKEAKGDYRKYVEMVEEYERKYPNATKFIPRDDNLFWYGADNEKKSNSKK